MAMELPVMMVQKYGMEVVSRKCVSFHNGKETVEDEPFSGQLATSKMSDNIEQSQSMLIHNQWIRMILKELKIRFSDTIYETF